MKILNLYAGIGGNRRLWGDEHQITAIEYKQDIANIYKDFFPKDIVIVEDAHEYLLKHFGEFDFIWSSPPCPSHSDIRRCGVQAGQYEALYPDMALYQEIILLRHFAPKEAKWVVENVVPYYEPLIAARKVHRHLFWANFWINDFETDSYRTKHVDITGNEHFYGVSLEKYDISDKRKIMRNMVDPKVGLHVFQEAFRQQKTLV